MNCEEERIDPFQALQGKKSLFRYGCRDRKYSRGMQSGFNDNTLYSNEKKTKDLRILGSRWTEFETFSEEGLFDLFFSHRDIYIS